MVLIKTPSPSTINFSKKLRGIYNVILTKQSIFDSQNRGKSSSIFFWTFRVVLIKTPSNDHQFFKTVLKEIFGVIFTRKSIFRLLAKKSPKSLRIEPKFSPGRFGWF